MAPTLTMREYSAIIFDLFDTIVNFNFNHLPAIKLKGFRSRTTSIEVYEVFSTYYPEVLFSDFYDPFIKSYHNFQRLKSIEYKEYPNQYRFKSMLESMQLKPIQQEPELIDKMVLAHMNALASCVEFPESNHETLLYLKKKNYRMAIISNFDYAPTAYSILEKFQLTDLFEIIIISEEVGWRKPKDIIFQTAINQLNIDPKEALFVGDNFSADVVGSKEAGMQSVWINTKNQSEKDLDPQPDYIIKKLSELRDYI